MNKYQAILAGFAASVGVGGIAAYNGAFAPVAPQVASISAPVGEVAKPVVPESAPAQELAKTEPAATAVPEVKPAPAPEVTPATVAPVAPVFDVLRVEPNGSVLIAGKADPNAQVEILSGTQSLGIAKAEANGDFAIVLENPLKPGDYQLVLRATRPDGQSAASVETATVSVPDKIDGPVLALVEEPGMPSRIITVPEAPAPAVEVAQAAAPAETPKAAEQPASVAEVTAAPVVEPNAPTAEVVQPNTASAKGVSVEAVEIEGDRIFIAGSAQGAATVRLYANDQLLGDAKAGEGDRYLLEMQKALAPGDYIIKAEGLAADGVTVVSRASVPFQSATPESAQVQAAVTMDANVVAGEPAAVPEQKKDVIIRRGDTLWQISRRIYGRGVRYSTIYLANKDAINDPNRIFPGQVMKIPSATPEGEAANEEEIKKRAEQN